MKQINLIARDSDVFKVLKLEGEEVTRITFSKQIDDVMLNLEGGDLLLSWDRDEWVDDECMLVKERDNMKEIGKLSCTHLLLKSRDGSKVTVYLVGQLN